MTRVAKKSLVNIKTSLVLPPDACKTLKYIEMFVVILEGRVL